MVSSNQLKGVDNLATTKNITMKQFNGTDYDTLYPKTIASQIPDVYSKTDTITAETLSRLGLGADKLPNDAFQQIKTLIDNVQSSTDSKARFQMGSYVGTGTYGKNNPCSLTFDFVPKVVYISQPTYITVNYNSNESSLSPYFIQMVNDAPIGSGAFAVRRSGLNYYDAGNSIVSCSFNDKTVSWHNFFISYNSYLNGIVNQMNNLGTTYHYTAIG